MKRLALMALLVGSLAYAGERLLGRIAATSSAAKNQATTGTAFTIPKADHIVVDCVATDGGANGEVGTATNVFLTWVATDAGTASATNFNRLTAFWETYAGESNNFLSVLCVDSAACSCHVSEATP